MNRHGFVAASFFVKDAGVHAHPKVGIGSESLRRWTLQAQIDAGQRQGPTSRDRSTKSAISSASASSSGEPDAEARIVSRMIALTILHAKRGRVTVGVSPSGDSTPKTKLPPVGFGSRIDIQHWL